MKEWEREMYWDEDVLRIQNETRCSEKEQGDGESSEVGEETALRTEKEGK